MNGGRVTIGYPYSLLEWCVEPHSSWSLPVDVRRVPSGQTAQEIGAEQVKALAEARTACLEALDIVAADGKYGNAGFFRPLQGQRCGLVVRLRKDRVLLTPQRVQQSIQPIFALIGTPALPPKVRGKPPGWPKGKPRTLKQRHKVVKKTPAATLTA